jgi:tetratricopeptide (TPR) repeat protein
MKRSFFFAVLLAAAPALAQPEDAGTHFRRGVELFKEADFRAALIEFKRANELSPNFRVLYNIGQCQLELQDYAGALRSYTRYLESREVPPDRRAAVEATVKKLQTRVAQVEIRTNVTGAEVHVDEDTVGSTPLPAPVLVSAGRRKILIEKAGRPPASKIIDIAGGDRTTVVIEMPEAPAPSVDEKRDPAKVVFVETPSPAQTSSRGPVWIGWLATGLLAAGAGVTGYFALDASGKRDDALAAFPGDARAIADANTRVRTFSLATDILTGTAILALGLSLYFSLKSPSKEARLPVLQGVF